MIKEFIRIDDGVIRILGLKFECTTISDKEITGGSFVRESSTWFNKSRFILLVRYEVTTDAVVLTVVTSRNMVVYVVKLARSEFNTISTQEM